MKKTRGRSRTRKPRNVFYEKVLVTTEEEKQISEISLASDSNSTNSTAADDDKKSTAANTSSKCSTEDEDSIYTAGDENSKGTAARDDGSKGTAARDDNSKCIADKVENKSLLDIIAKQNEKIEKLEKSFNAKFAKTKIHLKNINCQLEEQKIENLGLKKQLDNIRAEYKCKDIVINDQKLKLEYQNRSISNLHSDVNALQQQRQVVLIEKKQLAEEQEEHLKMQQHNGQLATEFAALQSKVSVSEKGRNQLITETELLQCEMKESQNRKNILQNQSKDLQIKFQENEDVRRADQETFELQILQRTQESKYEDARINALEIECNDLLNETDDITEAHASKVVQLQVQHEDEITSKACEYRKVKTVLRRQCKESKKAWNFTVGAVSFTTERFREEMKKRSESQLFGKSKIKISEVFKYLTEIQEILNVDLMAFMANRANM